MTASGERKQEHIVLVFGGDSAEREVSLRSGAAVAAALARLSVDYEICDGVTDCLRRVMLGGVDRVFNMLHGRGGEDGVLQGALQALGVPGTGSGVLGSALAMNKLASKRLWRGCGLPTPAFEIAAVPEDATRISRALPGPWFVKPAREGSSVGMGPAEDEAALGPAIEEALHYDAEVLVEKRIDGLEYTVALLHGQALPAIRIETPRSFYDYEAKYASGETKYHCPAGLENEQERALQVLAVQAFEALGCSGWGRVDIMVDAAGAPWLLEANTVPGMTSHSLVPMAARAAGIEFDALVERILATAEAPS